MAIITNDFIINYDSYSKNDDLVLNYLKISGILALATRLKVQRFATFTFLLKVRNYEVQAKFDSSLILVVYHDQWFEQ